MIDGYRIAIIGAQSLVGEAVLELLAERELAIEHLYALEAGSADLAASISFAGQERAVQSLEEFDFSQVAVLLVCAPAPVAELNRAAAEGCVVLDSQGYWTHDAYVPLVLAGLNLEALREQIYSGQILSLPHPASLALASVLAPVLAHTKVQQLTGTLLCPASEHGRAGVERLVQQTAQLLNGRPLEQQPQLAFNLLPKVGEWQDSATSVERRVQHEVQRLLDCEIALHLTAVQAPVFFAHALSVQLQLGQTLPAKNARDLLASASGVLVLDENDPDNYPTPVLGATAETAVYVARLRETAPSSLALWIVVDNVRKGIALNAVQITEWVLKHVL